MLNVNSPTVQAMLNNTPNGVGNMPVYCGNSPTVTQTEIPVTGQQMNSHNFPYPSPKEMLIESGQNAIYSPTSFYQPANPIVGGYNPYLNYNNSGFQMAFNGYSNPYMQPSAEEQLYRYLDAVSKDSYDAAMLKGISYEKQVESESSVYKLLSKCVSSNFGRTKEEAEEIASQYDVVKQQLGARQYNRPKNNKEAVKNLSVSVINGDTVIANSANQKKDLDEYGNIIDYSVNGQYFFRRFELDEKRIEQNNIIQAQLYNNAIERRYDNTPLMQFFNEEGSEAVMADMENKRIIELRNSMLSKAYNRDDFRNLLFKSLKPRNKGESEIVDRWISGSNGIMPNGEFVSPGHDPEIASSFSYNQSTGQYTVTAPNFLQRKIDAARQMFAASIDEN